MQVSREPDALGTQQRAASQCSSGVNHTSSSPAQNSLSLVFLLFGRCDSGAGPMSDAQKNEGWLGWGSPTYWL